MAENIPNTEIQSFLQNSEGWKHIEDSSLAYPALYKKFVFKSFSDAFVFMTSCAFLAEKIDHHPDWANSYNSVEVTLTTHSAKGITHKDIAMAEYMDEHEQIHE